MTFTRLGFDTLLLPRAHFHHYPLGPKAPLSAYPLAYGHLPSAIPSLPPQLSSHLIHRHLHLQVTAIRHLVKTAKVQAVSISFADLARRTTPTHLPDPHPAPLIPAVAQVFVLLLSHRTAVGYLGAYLRFQPRERAQCLTDLGFRRLTLFHLRRRHHRLQHLTGLKRWPRDRLI